MSHFSVVVIGENPEEQLAPYQENNMGDCPEEYLEFNDQEAKMLEEYETKSTHKIKGPDGSLYWSWDEKFRKPGTFGTGSDTHAIPSGYVEVEVPFKELYPTFEAFAEDYHGYKSRDEQKGRYGYWENNDAYMIEIDLGRYGNQNLQGLSENQTHNRILQDQEKTSWSDRRGNVLSLQNVCQDAQSGKNAGASSFLALETEIWNFIRSVCGDVGTAERVMCDLLEATFIETEDARGSLSQNRKDSRITLHALQHSIGTRSRRYKIVTKNDTLSAKAHVSNFYLYKGTKWDWYELGGRWTGYFPLKPGAEGITGRPGLMTDPAKKGYADAALLKDIDIERAQREEEVEARAKFAKWRRCFESFGRPESWEEVRIRICGDGESFDSTKLDEARAFYNGQVAIIECNKEFDGHYWGCPVEDFGFLEEMYVNKRKYGALVPFAVVKDGQWYERAEMGWFAITNNETMTYEDWCVQFHKMIAELPGDTLISMYDCHI